MRPVEAAFAGELARVRPELSGRYAAELPGARAAVMGRLWRGLLYEPLPGLRAAGPGWVMLADGRRLIGPERRPYDVRDEPELLLDGKPCTHPAALLEALALPGTAALVEDLDNSVASLALSRAGASKEAPKTAEEHEQSVIDGHPYHPGCRNRPGVSVAEQLAYMPEHRPTVHLDLLALPARDCLVTGPWPFVDGDRLLLPVHPWQTRHVLAGLGFRPHATGALPARPLMSVRTLAPLDGGPHLKTAFTTRMTSGVRDISPGSVRDCVPLSALLTTVAGQGGGLRIARYLAGAAGPVDGRPSADVSVMLRDPTPEPGPVLPLAALPAQATATWLGALARLLWEGALGMLAHGIALEAHGQNLLVVLDGDGRPYQLVYRDLADVRISPERLARHGIETPPVSARLLTDDPAVLHAKLLGSLAATTFGSLISAVGRGDRAVEGELWHVVATAARDAAGVLPAADRAALFAERLPAKAHLLTRVRGTGDHWTSLPNPLLDVP